jgi:predicted ester cyclase
VTDIATRVEAARASWDAGDLDGYLDLYDERIRLHGYSPEPMSKDEVTGFYRMIWAALAEDGRPNPSLQFHEVMVDGSMYCCRFTMSGVHQGEFMGVPATGRPYSMDGMTMMRFEGDRVVERWSSADFLGLLTQIGAIPAPAPAP